MPDSEPEIVFVCFFCGEAREDDDRLTLAAIWVEDGEKREQYWAAHRACLVENMSEETRALGGPLTGN